MKKFKVVLIVFAVLIVAVVIYCILRSNLNISIFSKYGIKNSNNSLVLYKENIYYYCDNDGVYSLDDKGIKKNIFPCKKPSQIALSDNGICIYPNPNLDDVYYIDFNGKTISQGKIGKGWSNLCIADNILFGCNHLDEIKAFDLNNSFNQVNLNLENCNIILSYGTGNDFNVIKKNNYSILYIKESDEIKSFQVIKNNDSGLNIVKNEGYTIFSLTDTNICYGDIQGSDLFKKIDLKTQKVSDTINNMMPGYNYFSINAYDNYVIAIGQDVERRGFGKMAELSYTSELKDHGSDSISIINIDTMKVENQVKTRKYERVIYTDTKKALTYYKGKILTYDINNWKVINKQDASYIKNNGSYSFVTSGNKIFVYQDNKVINIFDIT